MFCIFVLNVMEKEKNDDTYFHILKYTSLFGGVQGLNILVGLVRNKLVAMILGPDGMGIVSLFNSTIRFISDSTGLGIPTSAVKNLSQSISEREANIRDTVQLVRSWSLLAALVGLLACVILSPLLNDWTFSWPTTRCISCCYPQSLLSWPSPAAKWLSLRRRAVCAPWRW